MSRPRCTYSAAALLFFASGQCYASYCLTHPTQGAQQSISFGVVKVPDGVPPGTVIAERRGAPNVRYLATCIYPWRTSKVHLFTKPSPLGDGIYETNVKGIGIRTSFNYYNSGEAVAPEDLHVKWALKSNVGAAKVELIVTGPLESDGELQSGRLATAGFDGFAQAEVTLSATRIVRKRLVCQFLTPETKARQSKALSPRTTVQEVL
ncbi:hypothetical protein IM816_00680 [Luteibacter flocculans]|uniref:MrkD-like receptor binding domain-containing protein n=1 Tax=Luteibacter flocculans TaxID=2780091 RepID=A0ABY4T160_9GAMM|nr:hypothetical protein [Luteibacter flocculans]URL58691.1 hypothetical protein IM816_00680 [Luteibacter flocculans]